MFGGSTNVTLMMNGCRGMGVVVGPVAPSAPGKGQLWWDTNDGQLYVWTGSQWVAASCCDDEAP